MKSSTHSIFMLSPTMFPRPAIYELASSTMDVCNLAILDASSIQLAPRDYAKELLDRIRQLKVMYESSIGPNSTPPTSQAFSDAEEFVLKLPLNRTGQPVINVAADGEVNFDWSAGNVRIDLGFFGDGTYSYYGQGQNGEISGDDVSVAENLSGDFIKFATESA